MDAHVFRRFCDALIVLLQGARLEKIQSPASDVHLFTFYVQQHKHILCVRSERRNPCIFLSPERHSSGQHPPAATMRLRKYASGRRVKACACDWVARRLHLCFHGAPRADEETAPAQPETWITLDLRQGPLLTLGSSPDLGAAALWPTAQEAALCCAPPPAGAETDAEHRSPAQENAPPAWEQWPVLTPALRRCLPLLETEEQAALLADLEYGGGDIFAYSQPDSATDKPLASRGDSAAQGNIPELFAWPLPPVLRGQRSEQVYEDPLAALAPVGVALVLGGLARAGQRAAASPHSREAKRLSRVLEKLEQEESRLHKLLAGKEKALYLQSVLWHFPAEARPKDLADAQANPPINSPTSSPANPLIRQEILPPCPFDIRTLQGTLSLREHMEALFHGAARGARGLLMLEQRRALLRGQVLAAQEAAQFSAHMPPMSGPAGRIAKDSAKTSSANISSAKTALSAQGPKAVPRLLPKNVEAFVSVDGLTILRGKDAKGNLAMLKLGAAADLWLHVAGGPGAHTLIRRAFAGQEVPAATLEQAALLAAVKSWQKGNEKVEVQCAQVRHIKPMRGAAAGTVRIDKIECMVRVSLPLQQ